MRRARAAVSRLGVNFDYYQVFKTVRSLNHIARKVGLNPLPKKQMANCEMDLTKDSGTAGSGSLARYHEEMTKAGVRVQLLDVRKTLLTFLIS